MSMFAKPSSAFVGKPSRRRELLGQRVERAVGERVAVDEEEARRARRTVAEIQLGGLRRHPSIVSESDAGGVLGAIARSRAILRT